ncbi:UPF0598 protein C8orf82 homolog [Engraulis encrasicolus]|uniref:UPF0598 protein C8orf82 homolog n=1 Tax=Engraulis encrasicolus TaxID=184585 RepID=UPI002FCF488A
MTSLLRLGVWRFRPGGSRRWHQDITICSSCPKQQQHQQQQHVTMCSSSAPEQYIQGQSPEPRVREYFYYLDHQGQLFLDDTKIKNFVTCFKDPQFLVFFFSRVRPNRHGRYQEHFPFVSLCGRERNFLRCDDQPVVFTHLLPPPPSPAETTAAGPAPQLLSYCGGGGKLVEKFRPEALYVRRGCGRVYHPASERVGGVGLVRSALAMQLSSHFQYPTPGQEGTPTHFLWEGQRHELTNELAELLPAIEEEEEEEESGRET